jgi:valyl-tRNA synthetase
MAELNKTYNPGEVENYWYKYWMDNGFFHSTPNPEKEPYTIVIPPPNVTGVLHMGHMLNNTIQDVLIRKARMQGKEACWVPGTDHASIATEAKVVAMLKERGINKKDLTREEFLKYAWEWKEKYGGIILEQLKKLGASCDWERTRFTMDEDLSDAVIEVFIDLYRKGYIYRGVRMVNWDPQGKTALSDEEVNYKEVNSRLFYVNYKISGTDSETVTIATTRPETILGDTAICVNPNDDRYKHLVGKKAIVPFVNREIPIIADEYVDITFGTGCLKVTPAHDINDYNLGLKHNLPVLDILNDDGTLNANAQKYVGEDRFVVRKKIVKDLEEAGQIHKIEDIKNNVGFSERTDAVIEPKLSTQWFLKMETLAKPALENVLNDNIKLHPPKFKNMYRSWMENVRDWCISRQLWWGQRIPAWYAGDGSYVVAKTETEAIAEFAKSGKQLSGSDIRQDDDVLDTWFSSWLWPISVFDGFKDKNNPDIKYYYPTNDLVTAPEILFFWVARMIIAGYEYLGDKPFENVYLTGIVRDKLGRKMSKSLGNSPDPLELIDKYGADGVRMGMLLSSPAGNDLPFDEKLCEQGRNFSNKIWNAFRLIKGWKVDESLSGAHNNTAILWMNARFDGALAEIEDLFSKYRLSDALHKVYDLVWDDFCSYYLEMIKPDYEKPIDRQTLEATITIFEKLLKVVHPYMPFITEELWHQIRERSEKDCLIVAPWPKTAGTEASVIEQGEVALEVVVGVRNIRNTKQIHKAKCLSLFIRSSKPEQYKSFENIIQKLANIDSIAYTSEKPEGAAAFVVKSDEFYVPLQGQVDAAAEKERILKELEYTKGFLVSVDKKLGNEKFVASAKPEIVDAERKKKADAEAKIKALEESLAGM